LADSAAGVSLAVASLPLIRGSSLGQLQSIVPGGRKNKRQVRMGELPPARLR
jgi:hypothetical protein